MSKIIFCEGKHDIFFIKEIIQARDLELTIDAYVGEEVHPNQLKNNESEAISNFIDSFDYHPHDILVKSEGGKRNLKRVFSALVNKLSSLNVDYHVLIDLDLGGSDQLVRDLDEMVRVRYRGKLSIQHSEVTLETADLLVMECDLLIDGSVVDRFPISAFKDSLNNIAGIGDDDVGNKKRTKLRALVRDSSLTDVIVSECISS